MHIKESTYLKLVDCFFKQQDAFEDDTFGMESNRYKELFRVVAEFLDEVEYSPYEGTNQVVPKDLTQYVDEDDDGGPDILDDDGEPDLDSQELEDFAQDGYFDNMEPNDDGYWS